MTPLFAGCTVLTLGAGSLNVVLGPYLSANGLAEAAIGVVVMAHAAAGLGARLWLGAVYRSTRAPLLIAGATLAMGAGYTGLAMASSSYVVAALLALNGAGYGIATTATLAAVLERQPAGVVAGEVMGWFMGANGAGYAIAGFFAGPLADHLGLRSSIAVIAAFPLLAGLVLLPALRRPRPRQTRERPRREPALQAFRQVPAPVWVAFAISFYIALVNGGLFVFFPIYGLTIGITMTQIGFLEGVHGITATGVRFLSGPIFRLLSYRRLIPAMIALSAVALLMLSSVRTFLLLVIAWGTIGLSRGVLRVASGALVMDATGSGDQARGAASTIYLAGLDLGKLLGPPLAGITAEVVGLRSLFLVVGVASACVYVTALACARRLGSAKPMDAGNGTLI